MKNLTLLLGFTIIIISGCSHAQDNGTVEEENDVKLKTEVKPVNPNWNKLTEEEAYVIIDKGTERPFKGKYAESKTEGTYLCKQCNAELFESSSKFDSGTGWPSFDEFIGQSVEELLDGDGYRSEIVCANCKGHLGHVFFNEGFTDKNTRHCVNSISLNFEPAQ
ncbi:methionine-R-sulfoxide reductase [Crocinitomix catalasitica]|uniref:methionine-R-sulfoxide reductase n=1 Tax=Crocinitomix catalasitica TaxID=184607 RepID=UPI000486CE21|nr:methionine-R-sulfoxide reductase [Crocinitomix catalasitica]